MPQNRDRNAAPAQLGLAAVAEVVPPVLHGVVDEAQGAYIGLFTFKVCRASGEKLAFLEILDEPARVSLYSWQI